MTAPLPLDSGRYILDRQRIINPESGKVVLRYRAPEKTDRYYLELRDTNREYFTAPKQIGSLSNETLLEVVDRNIRLAEDTDITPELRCERLELAGSALQEISLGEVIENGVDIDTVDRHLQLIDYADMLLEQANLSLGVEQTTIKQRLVVKQLFNNVYKDIICGEITDQTVTELIDDLTDQLYKTYNNTDAVHSRGLAGEIHALLDLWHGYQDGSNNFVGIPSTVRGDSGFFRRDETHDIDILEQYNSNWLVRTPWEVKRRKITQWILNRYTKSDIIRISPTGESMLVRQATTPLN